MLESNQQDLHRLHIYDARFSIVHFNHLYTYVWDRKKHYDTAFLLTFILVLDSLFLGYVSLPSALLLVSAKYVSSRVTLY